MTIVSTAQLPFTFGSNTTADDLFKKTFPVSSRAQIREIMILDRTKQHLKKPIRVLTEQTETGNWVAYHPVILAHGYGKNEIEAAQDFHDMLIGLFVELRDSEKELAPHLKCDLEYLREIIVENSIR